MLSMIKHECREITIIGGFLFLFPLITIISTLITVWNLTGVQPSMDRDLSQMQIGCTILVYFFMPLLGFVLGFVQVLNDRLRKVSTFLATQPITRSQIFWGRTLVGVLYLVVVLAPLYGLFRYLDNLQLIHYEIANRMLSGLFMLAALLTLAAYSLGVLAGMHRSKIFGPILAVVALIGLYGMTVVYAVQTTAFVILTCVIIVVLVRARQKFLTGPL